jgi:Na+-transporting NADH:ubiquinone oxidoreductase subunit NqrF
MGRESADQSDIIGRLSVATMWQHIENPLAATYYISGPPLMLEAISNDLNERGVVANAIRVDAWE